MSTKPGEGQDDKGKTKEIWVRARQTSDPKGSATDKTLEQLLIDARDDVMKETDEQVNQQESYDNENPVVTQIAPDIDAKFSSSEEGVSKPIKQS